jgi:2-phosphoglycerate kinase
MRTPRSEDLGHVYWIGGSPAGGKSTLARRLAERYGLQLYVTDDVMREHASRCSAPHLDRFKAMTMDERWLTRSPRTMLETFHWFRGEAFHLIVEDLLSVPAGTRVVAEGFRLLPHLVAPLLADRRRAVWLLPTAEFREAAHEARGSTWTIPNLTSDPGRAKANLDERDAMFTDRLTRETARLSLPVLRLEPGVTRDEVFDRVSRMFGFRSSALDDRKCKS